MLKPLAKKLIPTPVWNRLRLMSLRRRVRNFLEREVLHSYGGFPLKIHLSDPLAQGWYDRDWEPLPELELLRGGQLREGARVFDLGAHQCVVALMLSRIVGPLGLVIAVEANAHNATVGMRNRELNHAEQLRVIHAAVAAKAGEIPFNEGLNGQVTGGEAGWGEQLVPAVSIDDLSREHGRPDVLFIDVEGFEIEALRGAVNTLESRPDCFVEVHVGEGLEKFGGSAAAVLGFLPEDKYTRFVHSESHRTPIPLNKAGHLLSQRFFLTALARR